MSPQAERLANSSLIKGLVRKQTSCPSQYGLAGLEDGDWGPWGARDGRDPC